MNLVKWVLLAVIVLRILFFIFFLDIPSWPDENEYLLDMKSITLYNLQPFKLSVYSSQVQYNYYPTVVLYYLTDQKLPLLSCLRLVTLLFSIGTIILFAKILQTKFNAYVTSLGIIFMGCNPVLLQFSLIGWFNIHVVFYSLVCFYTIQKAIQGKKYMNYVFIISLVLMLQAYFMGRIIAPLLGLLYFLECKSKKARILFVLCITVLLLPYVYSISMNTTRASERMLEVLVTWSDVTPTFMYQQFLATLLGLVGIPYGMYIPVFSPPLIRIFPIYFLPFLLIGLIKIVQYGKSYIKKNHIPLMQAFWVLIVCVVLGVNVLTIHPLNMSRSLLLLPMYIFIMSYGLEEIYKQTYLHNTKIFIIVVLIFLLLNVLSLYIYAEWLTGDFYRFIHAMHNNAAI